MISVLTLTLCVACSASVQTAGAAPDARASRITSVVAFPEHAEITREIEVHAPKDGLVRRGARVGLRDPAQREQDAAGRHSASAPAPPEAAGASAGGGAGFGL